MGVDWTAEILRPGAACDWSKGFTRRPTVATIEWRNGRR